MEFNVLTGNLASISSPCLVMSLFDDRQLNDVATAIDQAANGALTQALQNGDIDGDAEQTLWLNNVAGIASERILIIGCGKREEYKRSSYRKAAITAIKALKQQRIPKALWALHYPLPQDMSVYRCIWDSHLAANELVYRFDQLKSEPKPPKRPLTNITFWSNDTAAQDTSTKALTHATAVAAGVALARDLANLPGNICTPSYLANQAVALATNAPALEVQVLDEPELRKLRMGAFLGVSQGSSEPPRLIVLQYHGAAVDVKPIALVGKGITFDAGGISLKPGEAMDEMKFDMSGAASVLGTFKACMELQLPINLVGIIPACENLPDGKATKPGDILTSMSGITIEVLNTDAEGRLILADALTYSERFNPEVVIDIATLTGACVVALGKHPSGLFSNDTALVESITNAGEQSGDRVWRLPLWEEYEKQIDSPFADIANIGSRNGGGAITAACFLGRFTKKLRWAHLDIAGTAWHSGDNKGATGRPVPLLTQYLLQHCGLANP